MSLALALTDYKIRSLKIFKGAIIAYCLIHFAVIVAEYFLDLKSTSFEILLPSAVITIIVAVLSWRFPEARSVRAGLVLLMFFLVETHLLYNPRTFHVMGYWFAAVPLLALIIQGMRASQLWFVIILVSDVVNSLYVSSKFENGYQVTVETIPYLATTILYTFTILSASFLLYSLLGDAYSKANKENEELVLLQKSVEQKRNLLEKYLQDLISFSKNEENFNKGQTHLFSAICKTVSGTLGVSRVSIWLFEDGNSTLERKFLFETDHETDNILALKRIDYPTYFQALETRPFIIAPAARLNPDTKVFSENYLLPFDIYSLLDCPIVIDRKVVGVICCEHQHRMKVWNAEDTLFIQSLADFIALSYKNERITNLLFELQRKNFELVEKNNEIETMNEELNSLNEELTTVNETLEDTVKRRTNELATQNVQLTEYAFINSHLLRAPLSRILGLSQLIATEISPNTKDAELIEALVTSSNEMDAIIRRISEILYDGNNFTREDIKEIIERNLHVRNSYDT